MTRLPAARPLSAEERDRRARGGDLYKLALSRLPSFENHPLRNKNVWVDADGMEVKLVTHRRATERVSHMPMAVGHGQRNKPFLRVPKSLMLHV